MIFIVLLFSLVTGVASLMFLFLMYMPAAHNGYRNRHVETILIATLLQFPVVYLFIGTLRYYGIIVF